MMNETCRTPCLDTFRHLVVRMTSGTDVIWAFWNDRRLPLVSDMTEVCYNSHSLTESTCIREEPACTKTYPQGLASGTKIPSRWLHGLESPFTATEQDGRLSSPIIEQKSRTGKVTDEPWTVKQAPVKHKSDPQVMTKSGTETVPTV